MVDKEEMSGDPQEYQENKVYCANCEHCKLLKMAVGDGSQYVLRVRCAMGKWKKKSGEEKLHKYFTLSRRVMDSCEYYSPMGSTREFIKELRAALPTKDIIYS